MDELSACKKGFQTASGVFAQVLMTQSVILAVLALFFAAAS